MARTASAEALRRAHPISTPRPQFKAVRALFEDFPATDQPEPTTVDTRPDHVAASSDITNQEFDYEAPALTELIPSDVEIHADIDLIDKCNLLCPTCWRGTGAQKNAAGAMPIDTFRKVIDKVGREGFKNVVLINWTESFLNKDLDNYVPIVKEAGLRCWLSSNLSLNPKTYLPGIISSLAAGVDFLFVSVSGYTQDVYEINHKGGRLDWIVANLEGITSAQRSGVLSTVTYVKYLDFPYNAHQKALWGKHARDLGFGFMPTPAWGDPAIPMPSKYIFDAHVKHRFAAVEDMVSRGVLDPEKATTEIPDKVCTLLADRVAINFKGDAYLCCAFPNNPDLRIGHYTELDTDEMLLRRHGHAFCINCDSAGMRDTNDEDRDRFARAIAKHKAKNAKKLTDASV